MSNLIALPLFAQDFGDVLGIVIFIIIAIASWAAQALNQKKGKGPKQAGRRQRQAGQPRAQGPGGGARPAGAAQPKNLEDEIGDFLRQAARRRQEGQQPPAAQRPQQMPQPRDEPVEADIVVGRTEPRRPRPKPQGDPRLEELRAKRAQREAARAQERKAAARAKAADVEPAMPAAAAAVGAASTSAPGVRGSAPALTPGTTRRPSGSAAAIRQLFADPPSVRQAIIASEVLNRPADRWE